MLREEFLFDKRLNERMIKRGLVSREEYEEYLTKLPDVAAKGESFAVGPGEGQGEDDEPLSP